MSHNVPLQVNSLTYGRHGRNFNLTIFKPISRIYTLSISYEFALKWMPKNLTDTSSTSVMAWCCQTMSLHLCPCLPRSMSPYDVTGHQLLASGVPYHIAKDHEGLDSDQWIPLRGGERIPRGLWLEWDFRKTSSARFTYLNPAPRSRSH